jgi:poly(3-hydroxybutyrate) depolymerase
VLALHGAGGNGTGVLDKDRWAAKSELAGFIVVAPDGLPILYILGTKDPLMPIDGGEVKLPWGKRENPPVAVPLVV